jgi:hypothetical protein
MPWLLETQLSADAASLTIGQQAGAWFRSSWFDPEELTLAPRRHLVFDRRHAALLA